MPLVGAHPGMRLTGFALRPNPHLLGGHMVVMSPRSWRREGLDPHQPSVVDVACQARSGKGYELVVQVVRAVTQPVHSKAVLVHYRANDEDEGETQLRFNLGIGLGRPA